MEEAVEVAGTQELRAFFERTIRDYNEGRLDDYFAAMHENVTYYVASRPEPLVGKNVVRDSYARLSRAESVHWEAIKPTFIVAGPVGMVFCRYRHTIKHRGEPQIAREGHETAVFAFAEGAWRKVGEILDNAPPPPGQD